MICRGYRDGEERTGLRPLVLRRRDYLALTGAALMLAAVLLRRG
jgi:energy-coupling factor transporter transmembrane protein EcfT